MRDEKLHAVVARSTFRSQNVQNTRGADHFWKLRCRKSARRCGAKHISKSKCTKHLSSGQLLEVEMSKSARRCGAQHLSKSKVLKTDGFGALLEDEIFKKCAPLWREAHFEVNMVNTTCLDHSWTLKRCFVWRAQGIPHLAKSEQDVRAL